jgi:FKBP-type peptidyl-prolyl cis-trans isomerase
MLNLRHVYTLACATMLLACGPAKPPPSSDEQPEIQPGSGDQSGVATETKPAEPPAAAEAPTIPAPPDVAAPPADAAKTVSGLATKVLTLGQGDTKPKDYDKVKVHYSGWTTDGKMFDSSVQRGSPATFDVKGVVPGFSEGLQMMTIGEKRRLWIPEMLAYKGRPGSPQGMLVFDVELLEIIPGEAPIPAPEDVAAPPADAKKTASGIASKVLKAGTSKQKPHAWDKVTVNYSGWTTDGVLFDSSLKRPEPTSFNLDKVIPGWTEGLQLMTVGEQRRFWIPEELAYKGRPGAPQGMLVFDVELLKVEVVPPPPPVPKDVAAPPASAKRTPSGLAYRVIKKGTGKVHPTPANQVTVHYSGWTTDGKMFDSSITRGEPTTFGLGQVIPGWTEGLQLMVEGETTRFWIPEELAYKGRPGAPQGMLVFDVQLISIGQ